MHVSKLPARHCLLFWLAISFATIAQRRPGHGPHGILSAPDGLPRSSSPPPPTPPGDARKVEAVGELTGRRFYSDFSQVSVSKGVAPISGAFLHDSLLTA